MIPVTKCFLPPIENYMKEVKRAWDNQWLTNRGELVLELEEKLKSFLGSNSMIITNNGTVPLQIALKILGKRGEIITTPFSYVATTASIVWENCQPVFVDIHPEYLTIDETKIEEAITPRTTAILVTHVFGNPCDIDTIQNIAKKYHLKVIYDAAHCFGVEYKGQSVFNYGDVSTCSFHATKLFHTGEGGAMFCSNEEIYDQLFYSHNFGHKGPYDFHGLGINAKISELQAAMGLSVLPFIENIINERKKVIQFYDQNLIFDGVEKMKLRKDTKWNYSYYPIIFQSEELLIQTMGALNRKDIFPRRYFYPSLNTIAYTNGSTMPVSESISKRILCLPVYVTIPENILYKICEIINHQLC